MPLLWQVGQLFYAGTVLARSSWCLLWRVCIYPFLEMYTPNTAANLCCGESGQADRNVDSECRFWLQIPDEEEEEEEEKKKKEDPDKEGEEEKDPNQPAPAEE